MMMMSLSMAAPSSLTYRGNLNLTKSSFHGLRIVQMCPLRLPASSSSSSSSRVVMMAKKDEELKEIRAKTTEELHEEIVDLKGELFMLRLQRSARNEFKSSEFRRMRKKVNLLSLWFEIWMPLRILSICCLLKCLAQFWIMFPGDIFYFAFRF